MPLTLPTNPASLVLHCLHSMKKEWRLDLVVCSVIQLVCGRTRIWTHVESRSHTLHQMCNFCFFKCTRCSIHTEFLPIPSALHVLAAFHAFAHAVVSSYPCAFYLQRKNTRCNSLSLWATVFIKKKRRDVLKERLSDLGSNKWEWKTIKLLLFSYIE